jgi:hypothetical protein
VSTRIAADETFVPRSGSQPSRPIGDKKQVPWRLLAASADLCGLKFLVNQVLDIQNQVRTLRGRIEHLGRERLQAKLEAEQEALNGQDGPKTIKRQLKTQVRITSLSELDTMSNTC